jgi:hypothetical protein
VEVFRSVTSPYTAAVATVPLTTNFCTRSVVVEDPHSEKNGPVPAAVAVFAVSAATYVTR